MRVISSGVDSPRSVAGNSRFLVISSKVIQGVLAALLVASCATVPPAEPQIVTKEVKIPVAVACVDLASVPIEPGAVVLPLNDARLAADIAASQALKYKAWGRELYALIVPACTADPANATNRPGEH